MANFTASNLVRAVRARGRSHGVRTFDSRAGAVQPRPIEASCIEEGVPIARCTTYTESADRRLSSGLWECTAGKFRVSYALDEIVHILEGSVTVTEDPTGDTYTLHPGDAAYFPLGLVTHWHVPQFVKKFFVCRVPGGSVYLARALHRLGL